MTTNFDAVLTEIGSYGRFQKKIIVLSFLIGTVCAFNSLNSVFNHYTPDHRCTSVGNKSVSALIPNETDEWGKITLSSCKQYNLSLSPKPEIISCQNGLTYTGQFMSVISEFDIVCSFVWVKSTITSAFFASRIVTLLLVGFLADKYGRSPVLLTLLFLNFATSLCVSLSSNVIVYAAFITLYGATGSPSYIIMYSLGCESTGHKWRNLMNFALNAGYIFGYIVLPLIAYLSQTWRIYMRVIACWSILVLLVCIKFLPESSRWLTSKKDQKRALKCLRKIAKENKYLGNVEDLLINEDAKNLVTEEVKSTENAPTIAGIFKNIKFVVKVVILALCWMFVNITYFGLALNTSSFGGNIFMNCFYAGIMELPCIFIAYKMMDRIGRILTLSITFILGGIFCIASPIFKTWSISVSAVSAIIGKSIMTGTYYVVIGYTSEVFPTIIRARFSNICGSAGKIGAFISPFVMLLAEVVNPYFTFFTMGFGAIVVGILTLIFMPETNKVNLPETIEDVNKMATIRHGRVIINT